MIQPNLFEQFGEKSELILEVYKRENAISFNLMKIAFEQSQYSEVQFLAHKMAGSAKVVHAVSVASAASAIEQSVKNANFDIENLIYTLKIQFEKTCKFIEALPPSKK